MDNNYKVSFWEDAYAPCMVQFCPEDDEVVHALQLWREVNGDPNWEEPTALLSREDAYQMLGIGGEYDEDEDDRDPLDIMDIDHTMEMSLWDIGYVYGYDCCRLADIDWRKWAAEQEAVNADGGS